MTKLIEVSGEGLHDEKKAAASSAIKPGHIIEMTAGGEVQEHSTAAGTFRGMIALENLSNGGDNDTAYAVGEGVRFSRVYKGQKVRLRLAAGATAVTLTSVLEPAADGTVRVQATDAATSQGERNSIVAFPAEAVDNSGGSVEAFIEAYIA